MLLRFKKVFSFVFKIFLKNQDRERERKGDDGDDDDRRNQTGVCGKTQRVDSGQVGL